MMMLREFLFALFLQCPIFNKLKKPN